ncbi:MAG: hypothetical protein HOV79_31395, partial [Hamadaea sp.]|nr:hypothetical protein [Hamadaea sp.]
AAAFTSIMHIQQAEGIEVKVLDRHAVRSDRRLPATLRECVIFDGTASYETTPADRDGPLVDTVIELRRAQVEDRMNRFTQLWAPVREEA